MDDLERDFLSSPGEHLSENCWCRHPGNEHKPDPARDYRELLCSACIADKVGRSS